MNGKPIKDDERIIIMPVYRGVLYADKKLAFRVLSRHLIGVEDNNEPYFVVSISDKKEMPCKIRDSHNRKAVLRVSFYDTETTKGTKPSLAPKAAKEIADFVDEQLNNGIKLCVINCEMGMSRSAGVAAGISKAVNGEDELFYQFYRPNANCHSKMINAFMGCYDNE